MDAQTCTCATALALQDQINSLEARLNDALARNAQLELELAASTLRVNDLERDAANERELRESLEEAIQDNSIMTTLERIIARHSAEMQTERARLDAATVCDEQAILDLVARHRREIYQRLDHVLDQNKAMFARIAATVQDLWAARGTTRPSLDKEHWFLLAREEDDEPDGNKIVTFKIHSGQRSYIDRIGKDKDVVLASPAANGGDVRQTAKKRMRSLIANQSEVSISGLRFSCPDADSEGFFVLLLESIEVALTAPTNATIMLLKQEATKNLRDAFDLDVLFGNAAVAA